MRVNLINVLEPASSIFVLVLFPGFFLYHTLVAMGAVSPFLAGLFGPVSAVALIVYCVLFLGVANYLVKTSGLFFVFCFLFFVFVFVWSLVNFVLQSVDGVRAAFVQSLELLILWGALFFIGCFIPLESHFLRRAMLFSFFFMVGYLLFFVMSTGEVMFYAKKQYSGGESVATYQGFARSGLLILLFLLSIAKGLGWRLLFSALGVFVLFVLGGRSELYSYIFVCGLFYFLWSLQDRKSMFLAIFLIFVFVVLMIGYVDLLLASRQLQVIDLSSSSSWLARNELLLKAIDQVKENPVLGLFGGHIDAESVGGYAHNVLSAWVSYGLFGFSLYFSLAFYALYVSFFNYIKKLNNIYWAFSFACNACCMLLILIAKPVYWPLVAIAWGSVINARRQDYIERTS
jgi:hypothetical protein